MSCTQKHALGRELRFFAMDEATCGTYVEPSSADAIKILTSTFDWQQERVSRDDSRQTRSLLERITRRKTVSWSTEGYLIPSGVAATEPDVGAMLTAAMGADNAGAGSTWVYSLSSSQTVPTLSLAREASGSILEALFGAWVDNMTISVPGGEEAKISFDGGAFDGYQTGFADLATALVGAETSFEVSEDQGENFVVGSEVMVGTSGPHTVTAVTPGTPKYTISISPDTITGAQGTDADVVPYVPTETTAGNPIAGISGSLDLTPTGSDGTALTAISGMAITSFEVTVANQIKPIDDEAFQDAVTDMIPGFRMVTGTIGLRAARDKIIHLARRKNFQVHDLDVRIGPDTAGSRCKISLPTIELDSTTLDIPEAEEATFNLPFTALGSSGEDEMTVTFD